jgi:hypothetical protein
VKRGSYTRTRAFAGNNSTEHEPQELLAMQKVEGSNPFSRFEKAWYLQVFFVDAVGGFAP